MPQYDYDLFIIGAGSAGVRAARIAAGFGARVAIAEGYRPGGTCVIRGCIPKKLLVYASHFREDLEDAAAYGWTAEARFSWPTLIANKDREIARLEDIYRTLLKAAGVVLFEGRARFADPHTVEVTGHRCTAANVLVATGGRPVRPAVPGAELAITSDEAFGLPDLPRRVLLIGGGYIAAEFAGIFNGMGSDVTIVYRGEQILRGFDDDVRQHLHDELRHKGVHIRLLSDVVGIRHAGQGAMAVECSGPGGRADIDADAVMFATGRRADTAGLGLEAIGVGLDDRGAVMVDTYSRSSVPHVFAVGDVTDRVALTPVAIREGAAAATTLFGGHPVAMDHCDVPHAVFSQPPVATVGLTESQAVEEFGAVDVYAATFRPLRHTLSGRNERTLVKLVVEPSGGRVAGAHMVGPDAPEIIQGIAIAVKAGLTKAQFDATVAIHPTAAEEFVTLRDSRRRRG
jgi:glutathione reductase (NADPH)